MHKGTIIIFSVILLIGLVYFVSFSENFGENIKVDDSYSKVNLPHYPKMPITYALDVNTSYYQTSNPATNQDDFEIKRIKWALELIEQKTEGLVKFEEVTPEENPNIMIYGVPEQSCYSEDEDFGGKEGFAGPNITEGSNIIYNGDVVYCAKTGAVLAGDLTGLTWNDIPIENLGWYWQDLACDDFPVLELHEILHALGFDHFYDDSSNLMYPVDFAIQICQQDNFDERYVSCLKNIYSNSEEGTCEGVDLFPWKEDPIVNQEDFTWKSLPVNYTAVGCADNQVRNLKRAASILDVQAGFNYLEFSESLEDSQIVFECRDPLDDVLLNWEADFWTTTDYFPAAQPYFDFGPLGDIKSVRILLFSEKRKCGGIELHEFIHALGLRRHIGYWMKFEREVCDIEGPLDSKSLSELSKLYGYS